MCPSSHPSWVMEGTKAMKWLEFLNCILPLCLYCASLILRWKVTVCLSIPSSYPFMPMLPVSVSLCHLFISAILFAVSRWLFSPSPGIFHVLLDRANQYIVHCILLQSWLTGILRLCTLSCLTESFTAFELCISLSTKPILSGLGESSGEYWDIFSVYALLHLQWKISRYYWREGK